MDLEQIISLDKQYFMNTFGERVLVCFTHGKGCTLYDTQGRAYTDFFAGIATCALGYQYPSYTAALHSQIDKLLHTSNVFYVENQGLLAQALVENSFADRVFLANSGTEANEGAVKLARRYWKDHDPRRYKVISLMHSFHGRTLAMVAATAQPKYQAPYTPLPDGFVNVELGSLEALENAIDETTAAVIMEVVQGEGGVTVGDPTYVRRIESICRKHGILLIVDEVQTGMGRTGKLFGYQHYGITPDIMTLAKALGNGIPMGAILARDAVCAFQPGDHGSTFGGNTLACTAGLAVMHALLDEGVLAGVEEKGAYLKEKLLQLQSRHACILEVRGLGLLLGIELDAQHPAKEVMSAALAQGFVVGTAARNTLRLAPPLIISLEAIDALAAALDKILA